MAIIKAQTDNTPVEMLAAATLDIFQYATENIILQPAESDVTITSLGTPTKAGQIKTLYNKYSAAFKILLSDSAVFGLQAPIEIKRDDIVTLYCYEAGVGAKPTVQAINKKSLNLWASKLEFVKVGLGASNIGLDIYDGIAIGSEVTLQGTNAIGICTYQGTLQAYGVLIAPTSGVVGTYGVAIGSGTGSDSYGTSIGASTWTGIGGSCLGYGSYAETGVGIGRAAQGYDGIAIGAYSDTTDKGYAIALGRYAVASNWCEMVTSLDGANPMKHSDHMVAWRGQTTDEAATELTLNNTAGKYFTVPNTSVSLLTIDVTARDSSGNCKIWQLQAGVKQGASSATIALIGSLIKNVIAQDTSAAAWDCDIQADTVNGRLKAVAQGAAATTINWLFKANITQEII